jgi:Zn-finger nucleic acid-binding protein
MLCPQCRVEMPIVETRGVELDVCVRCEGVWFDADELQRLFTLAGSPSALDRVERNLADAAAPRSRSARRCPRCRARLETVDLPAERGAVPIERCGRNDGLWFDRGELQAVVAACLPAGPGAEIQRFLAEFLSPRTNPRSSDAGGGPECGS